MNYNNYIFVKIIKIGVCVCKAKTWSNTDKQLRRKSLSSFILIRTVYPSRVTPSMNKSILGSSFAKWSSNISWRTSWIAATMRPSSLSSWNIRWVSFCDSSRFFLSDSAFLCRGWNKCGQLGVRGAHERCIWVPVTLSTTGYNGAYRGRPASKWRAWRRAKRDKKRFIATRKRSWWWQFWGHHRWGHSS